jgi:hypothetical protein
VVVVSIMLHFPVSAWTVNDSVISFTLQLLYPEEKELWYSLNKKVGRSQDQTLYSENISLMNT